MEGDQMKMRDATIADVLADFLQYVSNTKIPSEVAETIVCYLDRIKAAAKRERETIEANAIAVGGIVEAARAAEKSSAVGNSGPRFDLCRDVESVLRIGREFQKQDRWRGAHHDTAKLLCDTIECLRDSLNTPVGNAAAMREAQKAINCINIGGLKRLLVELVEADIFDGGLINKTISAVEKARSAIAVPPRVCDVNTLESLSDFVEKIILTSDLLKDTHEIVKSIVMASVRTALAVAYEPAKSEGKQMKGEVDGRK